MAKKHKLKINLQMALVFLVVLVLLAVAVQAWLIKQLYDRTDQQANYEIKEIMIDTVRALNEELVTDAQTGRRFVPSVRVVLPATDGIRLFTREASDDSSIYFLDEGNQSQAGGRLRAADSLQAVFNEVQNLQRCSRQVIVSFNKPNPESVGDKLTLKNTKKLKDGRTAYVYQNECMYGAEPMLRTLEKLESY